MNYKYFLQAKKSYGIYLERELFLKKSKRKAKEGLRDWGQQMPTIIYTLINNKVLLYSTENCIQYPVINNNGKEKYVCIYIYIYTHTNTVYITESLFCTAEIKHGIESQLYINKMLKTGKVKNLSMG